ncbi:MAG TPA: carboxypeptidase-like regulatory domain-containing protein [Candidatus Brocadiia bacterium]|nr:carboxypeptidase-like regulatory domain-containing protein [Candidatus Brocadiales bacterium]
MKKVLIIFGILLMVHSLSTWKVFPSEIRTVTTKSCPPTTCPAYGTYCRDADGDGYGDPADSIVHCIQELGYVPNCTDCDDTDQNVHGDCGCQCPEFSVTGCISGTVVNGPNGPPLPGMTVILKNMRTGIEDEVTTDSIGCYLFTNLMGRYILKLKGCKSRSSKRERTVVFVDFGTVNKNIVWWRNRCLTRCFYRVED